MADWKIDDKSAVVTPATTDTFPVSQSGIVKKITTEQILTLVNDSVNMDELEWKLDDNTWTPEATGNANFPEWVININADMTFLKVGQKIKYTQPTTKYGIITKVGAWSGSATPLTIYMGGTVASPSYPMTAAAITTVRYSMVNKPIDFPIGLDMWSTNLTDGNYKTIYPPTINVWYGGNTGFTTGSNITSYFGTGLWEIEYSMNIQYYGCSDVSTTLSNSNSSESDGEFTNYFQGVTSSAGDILTKTISYKRKDILLTGVTQYWLMTRWTSSSANRMYHIYILGNYTATKIKAKCLYV